MSHAADDVTELVRSLITQIADEPEAVEVTGSEENGELYIEVAVAEGDIGKVIGRQGRIIKAIRTLARAAASKADLRVEVELAD